LNSGFVRPACPGRALEEADQFLQPALIVEDTVGMGCGHDASVGFIQGPLCQHLFVVKLRRVDLEIRTGQPLLELLDV
jgi:hypothetical protein